MFNWIRKNVWPLPQKVDEEKKRLMIMNLYWQRLCEKIKEETGWKGDDEEESILELARLERTAYVSMVFQETKSVLEENKKLRAENNKRKRILRCIAADMGISAFAADGWLDKIWEDRYKIEED